MKKILFIDDDLIQPVDEEDPFVRKLSTIYIVVDAIDGDQAWDMLAKDSYDLIILDIMIPHEKKVRLKDVPRYRTGIFLLEQLRNGSFPKNSQTPVLIFSAIADQDDMNKIKGDLKEGERYLEKPIYPSELLDVVHTILGD